ncbi:MAG: hypothetical protein ACYSUI_08245 [Planctomycetota bacterium]|jgi:hypothetical protein
MAAPLLHIIEPIVGRLAELYREIVDLEIRRVESGWKEWLQEAPT